MLLGELLTGNTNLQNASGEDAALTLSHINFLSACDFHIHPLSRLILNVIVAHRESRHNTASSTERESWSSEARRPLS